MSVWQTLSDCPVCSHFVNLAECCPQGIAPLHVAAKWGKMNMVKLLMENNAKKGIQTRDGLTPLHCAARSGHDQVGERKRQTDRQAGRYRQEDIAKKGIQTRDGLSPHRSQIWA